VGCSSCAVHNARIFVSMLVFRCRSWCVGSAIAQIHSAVPLCAVTGFLFFDSGVGCMVQSPDRSE
jgi:hypothetical protein